MTRIIRRTAGGLLIAVSLASFSGGAAAAATDTRAAASRPATPGDTSAMSTASRKVTATVRVPSA